MNLKFFSCHKTVQAAEIVHVEELTATIFYLDADGQRCRVAGQPKLFMRHFPTVGDYLVRYEDGYLSVSPKRAFETGYSPLAMGPQS